MSAAVAEWIYRWRRVLTSLILIGTVLLAWRIDITNIDNDLTAWFSVDDPIYQQYERFRDEFGGTRTLIVAIEAPSRDRLFSREGFAYLDAVTAAIERLPAVERVSSLATATVVDARPAESAEDVALLDVRALFDDLATESPAAVGQRALDDALLRGDLISEDGTVAAIIVFFDERRIDAVRAEVLEGVRAVVDVNRPDGFVPHYNGSLEISETYNRVTLANQATFTPPILVMTLLAIFLMFRSWRITVFTLGAVLISLIWTLGLYDLAGFSFNVLSSMIVPLTVVLAIADDVHIIQHYLERRRNEDAERAFKGTVSHLFAPILGATATTALGMASLATSDVVAVREFGLGAAMGVSVDFMMSIVLVPTVLGWLKPEAAVSPQEAWFKGPLLAVSRLSTSRPVVIVSIAGGVAVLALVGLSRVRVDTNHISFFSPSHPLGVSARVIDSKLGGIYSFQVMVEGPADSLRQPDILRRMYALQERLRQFDYVRKVTGLADYVRRVHSELGDGGGEAGIPGDARVVAQELFVFALADQGRVELDRVATRDFSVSQITVKQAAMSSDLLYEQILEADRIVTEAFAGTPVSATVTGSGRLFATLDSYLVRSQISSFATAFVTVFGVIMLVFRSWRFGLLAIVPNLFPVLAIFGAMGWLDISLNVATVMLASVALGIVDDDTVHFISRYRREVAGGQSSRQAIEAATIYEGRAAFTAVVINTFAFAVLALSEYRPTAWFGSLMALTMLVAFLAEVFILPATIMLLPRLFGTRPRLETHGPRAAR